MKPSALSSAHTTHLARALRSDESRAHVATYASPLRRIILAAASSRLSSPAKGQYPPPLRGSRARCGAASTTQVRHTPSVLPPTPSSNWPADQSSSRCEAPEASASLA
eukprot:scaffold125819_cov60-Phaeocystis_antarctica.AAC.1